MIEQYIPEFQPKRESYALHNAGPDSISVEWAGVSFTLPGNEEIHSARPARFEDGEPIPGTLLIFDSHSAQVDGSIPNQADPYNWKAQTVIKNVLGIDPASGRAIGSFARKGVSFIPQPITPESLAPIAADGQRRYFEFMVEWADHQVTAHAEAVDRANRAGVSSRPPGRDYHRAVSILEKHKAEVDKRYGPQRDTITELAEEDDTEFILFAKARLMALAEKAAAAHKVDRQVLADEMMEDPDVLKNLRRKYRIRKKGYAEGVDEAVEG
jgi:hypothetical protein